MGSKGWIKRVLPFFATFAIGIFIAGLFGFGGPRFGRHGRWQMRAEMDRMRAELNDVKNENLRLKNSRCGDFDDNIEFDVTPDLPVVPPPPMHHHPPGDRGFGHGSGSASGPGISR